MYQPIHLPHQFHWTPQQLVAAVQQRIDAAAGAHCALCPDPTDRAPRPAQPAIATRRVHAD